VRKELLIVATYLAIAGASVMGQAGPAGNAAEPQAKPVSEAARMLQALEGKWSIIEELAPDASSPSGGKGEGQIVWRSGPGGYSVIEEYQSREGNRDITGLGVFWWDDTLRGFKTIWCDSTNPGGCISFGNVLHWEGSNLVLSEDYEVKGKELTFKEVFGDITPQTFTQTLYGGEAGGPLKIDQVIHAKRIAGGAK
jgi:hypothetical protein